MAGNAISMEVFIGTSSINGGCICDGTMIYTTLDSDEGDHWSMFNLHNFNDYLLADTKTRVSQLPLERYSFHIQKTVFCLCWI
jgi:hypothetical protein